jgi:hypothetical protein
MPIKGLKKKTAVTKKRQTLKFTVDCSVPVADNVLDAAGLVSPGPSDLTLSNDDNSFPV